VIFWNSDRFNFIIDISEWSISTDSGVHTLIVALFIKNNTSIFMYSDSTGVDGFTINFTWDDPRSRSSHEVPLLDISLETSILLEVISS